MIKLIIVLLLLITYGSDVFSQKFSSEIAIRLYGEAKDDSLRTYLNIHDDCNTLKDSIIHNLYSGKLYRVTGMIEEAKEPLYKALGLIDFASDNLLEAKILDELSIINRKNSIDIDKAIEYIKESIRIKTVLNDTVGLATSDVFLGNIYYELRDSSAYADSARAVYIEALRLCEECKKCKESLVATINFNLGTLELDRDEYVASKDFFSKASEYYQKTGNVRNQLRLAINEASLYSNQSLISEFQKKLIDIEEINIDGKWQDLNDQIKILKIQYLKFTDDSLLSVLLHDSLHLERDKQIQASIISNLKLDQKAASTQRDLQIKKRNDAEALLNRRRIQLFVISLLAVILCLIALGIYKYQSLKKKSIESELEKTKIQANLDITRAKMEGEQEERKVIASVLHDQVASLLTAADMHLAAARKKGKESGTQALYKADEIIKDVNEQVRNLSHQLLSPTLMKFGLGPAIDSLCNKLHTDELRITFNNDIGDLRVESSYEIFLYRSCSELLNNAMKYSNGNSAHIELFQSDEVIKLVVSDNGVSGPLDEDNFGLGLAHIKNNSEALNGRFEYLSDEEGFKAAIELPITNMENSKRKN